MNKSRVSDDTNNKTVALFVTCLADLFRPNVAFATIKLLEDAGCRVEVPELQTCCGQPAYNTGAYDETRVVAKQVIEVFADYSWVVAPSGSCAGMIKHHYPKLLKDSPEWHGRAIDLAERTWEITGFLAEVLHYQPTHDVSQSDGKTYTYHDSCAGLREMAIKDQPRQLLKNLQGIELEELANTEVCCGFGGTFCVKMPEISEKMVDDKLDSALATEADVLLGGDLGCLMNIAGRASRRDQPLEVRHVVEVLAGMTDTAAIGESQT